MRFVLDNSVVMRWLLSDGSEERLAYASKVLDLLSQDTGEALVPGVWALEVANVLVKAQAKGLVTEARASAFVGLLAEMAITVDASTAARALGDTLQLARRAVHRERLRRRCPLQAQHPRTRGHARAVQPLRQPGRGAQADQAGHARLHPQRAGAQLGGPFTGQRSDCGFHYQQ